MTPRWQIVVPIVVILALGSVLAIYPQDVSDIASMARDLKNTLKDVDERLRHLEQLVKDLTKAANKTGSRVAVSLPSGAAASAKSETPPNRIASQEAYQKGRIEEDSQLFDRALELFTKACELDPANESAFLHRAFVHYRTGRVDEALSDVNRSLAIQPDNSGALAFRATLYRTMKDYDRAAADLAEAVRRDSRNSEYLVSQAGVEEERGNFSKAVDLYAAALVISPQSMAIHLKRATALEVIDNRKAFFEECAQAIALGPKEPDGYTCRAEYYVRSRQFFAAVEDLNQAIALRPDFQQAVSLLPVVRELIEVNRAEARQAEVNQAEVNQAAVTQPKPRPETPPAAPPAASLASAAPPPNPAGSPGAPPSDQRAGPQAAPAPAPSSKGSNPATLPVPVTLPSPSYNLLSEPAPAPGKLSELLQTARTYLDHGMFAQAILKLNEAIALNAPSSAAYNARGYAYLRSHAYSSALSDFSKAIELRPSYANAYWNRAVVHRLQGDAQAANEDAQKALQLGWVATNSGDLKTKAGH